MVSIRIPTLASVLVCLTIGGGSTALGQVTGRIIGTVSDNETGQPLAGAQVVVDGTSLQSKTKEDGSYLIENAPVGLHNLTVQYLNYQRTHDNHRILAGQTTKLDFQIDQAEQIGSSLKRARLVYRENIVSETSYMSSARLSVNDISGLGVGIYPHPQLLPVDRFRSIGRDEIGAYLAIGRNAPDRPDSDARRGNLQPRLQVRDWPREPPGAGVQAKRTRADKE